MSHGPLNLSCDPWDVTCPTCGSTFGRPCTAPTATGRRPVMWSHDTRRDLAQGWT